MLWAKRAEGALVVELCVQANEPAAATGRSGIADNARPEAATNNGRRAGKEGITTMVPSEPYGPSDDTVLTRLIDMK